MGRRFDPDRAHLTPGEHILNYAKHMQTEIIFKRLANSLLIIGPIVSLAVSPASSYDPINLIKQLFMCTISFYGLGLILNDSKTVFSKLPKWYWVTSLIFVISMLSSTMFSGAPINQQIWGTFGRNTGFLTYFTLFIILTSTAIIQKTDFYHKLVNGLLLTAVPMTVYCAIQVAKLDPVGWSSKAPFGTLGNINFSSAFFGISSICGTVLILEKRISKVVRLVIGIMVIIDLLIVLSTGSIQGFMIFIAGIGLAGYLYIRSGDTLRKLRLPYAVIAIVGVVVTVMGLSNKGPLAKFLFAPSIVFRTDYWHAGLQMTLDHPVFGVGLDSYGDWYRSARGLISTVRTSPDRIANTAHNIFLDISSNGGIPFISSYLALNFFAFRAGIRILKRDSKFIPYFAAIFSTWFGYLIFSAISINQVGVGIWGWLFTGALIGYEIATKDATSQNPAESKKAKRKRSQSFPAGAGVLGLVASLVGFSFAFVPFNADMKYKSALLTRGMDKIINSTEIIGSTAFHVEMALDLAISNNLQAQALELAQRLNRDYPRDFMGWKAMYVLSDTSDPNRTTAAKKQHELDPFNPNLPKS